jgi:hypothetical protein
MDRTLLLAFDHRSELSPPRPERLLVHTAASPMDGGKLLHAVSVQIKNEYSGVHTHKTTS